MKYFFIQLFLIISISSIFATEIPEIAWIDSVKGLNLRSSPNIKSTSIQLIPFHAKVEIIEFNFKNLITIDGIQDYWVKAKYKGKTGWLYSGYLIYTEPLSENQKTNLLNELQNILKNNNTIIKDYFSVPLNKIQKLRIEFKNKSGRYIEYYIDIIRFNNKFFSETNWYEGESCINNYISLNKDYNDYLNSNKNILKSFNSLYWPGNATSINKVSNKNVNFIEQDVYFLPTDQYYKSLVHFKNNYVIICTLGIDYNIWLSINKFAYNRSDWFYKYDNTHFKLKNEGMKYYNIAEKLLLSTIDMTNKY